MLLTAPDWTQMENGACFADMRGRDLSFQLTVVPEAARRWEWMTSQDDPRDGNLFLYESVFALRTGTAVTRVAAMERARLAAHSLALQYSAARSNDPAPYAAHDPADAGENRVVVFPSKRCIA